MQGLPETRSSTLRGSRRHHEQPRCVRLAVTSTRIHVLHVDMADARLTLSAVRLRTTDTNIFRLTRSWDDVDPCVGNHGRNLVSHGAARQACDRESGTEVRRRLLGRFGRRAERRCISGVVSLIEFHSRYLPIGTCWTCGQELQNYMHWYRVSGGHVDGTVCM